MWGPQPLQDNNCYTMMKQIMEKGHLHDMDTMIGKLRELLGDCTFAEAYERTGGVLQTRVKSRQVLALCCRGVRAREGVRSKHCHGPAGRHTEPKATSAGALSHEALPSPCRPHPQRHRLPCGHQ